MDKSDKEIANSTKGETALDIASFVSSAVPWIGGPVSNVLGGMSAGRKLKRVGEVLTAVTEEVKNLKSDISQEYVQTEDFEDLLENALRKVSEERNEEKRYVYQQFLVEAIKSPGEPYDEQIRFLRTLEEIQVDHLKIIQALSLPPGDTENMRTGSPGRTLEKRLFDFQRERINDLVSQLNDMRLIDLSSMNVMMTAHGAEDLRHTITDYGKRFLGYLKSA